MDDYAYINARVRALRSDLLDQRVYVELVGLPDVSSIRDALGHTLYGKRLGDIPVGAAIVVLEEWLREEWSRAVAKLYRITDGRAREHLEILLGRWEVENLKAILRGRKANAAISEILATVMPVGSLDDTALAELARQPTIQMIVDLLTTWRSQHARPLREALRGHRELKGLEPLELALDHHYFEDAVKRLEGGDQNARLLRELIGLLIDRVNLLTAFKISNEGLASWSDISTYFIEGGSHVPISVYDALVRAQGLREVVELIRKTPYSGIVEGLEREQVGIPISVRLERGLERIILDRARVKVSSDPLGVGLMIVYLWQKYHEVGNIRIILRAKTYDMYPEDVRSLLVM